MPFQDLATGVQSMAIVYPWSMDQIAETNPDTYANLKVVPLPQLDTASPSSRVYAYYWAVNKASKEQAEAWKFVQFLSEHSEEFLTGTDFVQPLVGWERLGRGQGDPVHRDLVGRPTRTGKFDEVTDALLGGPGRDHEDGERRGLRRGSHGRGREERQRSRHPDPPGLMVALSTTTRPPALPAGGLRPHRARRSLVGFLFAVPALALFLLFAIYPGVQVFGLSLFDYSLTSPPEFVGFDNFAFLSTDPRFGEALLQTVFYAVGHLPAGARARADPGAGAQHAHPGHGPRASALLPAARDELGGGLDHLAGRAAPGRDAQRGARPRRQLAHELRRPPAGRWSS